MIFRDQATTGDGLLTAVRFLSLAAAAGDPGRRARGGDAAVPAGARERRGRATRNGWTTRARSGTPSARAEDALGGAGRVLVRASGTEPLVRVMVEAESEELARTHADAVAERIASALA